MTIDLVKCKCGGTAKYVYEPDMIDSFKCDTCDYQTRKYYDGEMYAYDEWQRRNTDRPSAAMEEVQHRMKHLFEAARKAGS